MSKTKTYFPDASASASSPETWGVTIAKEIELEDQVWETQTELIELKMGGVWKMEEQGEINIGYQGDYEMTWMFLDRCFGGLGWIFIQDLGISDSVMTNLATHLDVDPLELIRSRSKLRWKILACSWLDKLLPRRMMWQVMVPRDPVFSQSRYGGVFQK